MFLDPCGIQVDASVYALSKAHPDKIPAWLEKQIRMALRVKAVESLEKFREKYVGCGQSQHYTGFSCKIEAPKSAMEGCTLKRDQRGKSPNEIIREVAAMSHVSVKTIKGPERHHEAIAARFIAVRRLKDEKHLSYSEIGRLLNRDHSTILHAYRKAKKQQMEQA